MPWTDAAKRVNDYLHTKWRAEYDKRAHLFAPRQEATARPSQRPQGDQPGIRRSHTLTNGNATQATTPPPPEPPVVINGRINADAHRAATKRKMRAAFARQPDE